MSTRSPESLILLFGDGKERRFEAGKEARMSKHRARMTALSCVCIDQVARERVLHGFGDVLGGRKEEKRKRKKWSSLVWFCLVKSDVLVVVLYVVAFVT